MHRAFRKVRRNRGVAGIDKISITMFEANLEQNLLALMHDLKKGTFQPLPLRRAYIPKAPRQTRPPGLPPRRSRVAHEVLRPTLNPRFHPGLPDHPSGLNP